MLLKFTHPKLLQICMSFYLLLNTKKDILKNDWNFGTIDFHSIYFFCSTMEVNGSNHSSKFCRRKKLTHVCNNLRVSKWVWVDSEYPFQITTKKKKKPKRTHSFH